MAPSGRSTWPRAAFLSEDHLKSLRYATEDGEPITGSANGFDLSMFRLRRPLSDTRADDSGQAL
ncbi:hypothetical protein ABTZ99_39005 [Actinosynnema sp. NPDC002837]